MSLPGIDDAAADRIIAARPFDIPTSSSTSELSLATSTAKSPTASQCKNSFTCVLPARASRS
jgi:hypothetical protein